MKRRHFLTAAGLSFARCAAVPLLARQPKRGRTQKNELKKLVVIFQRGGNDAINTLAPVGDREQQQRYRAMRPDLSIPNEHLLSLNPSPFFGFHPSLAPLSDIINAGKASFVHAVGYPSMNTSHFVAQSFLETAEPGNRRGSGWLNRFFAADPAARPFRALMVAANVSQTMTGPYTVPVSNNFGLLNMPLHGRLAANERDAYEHALRTLAVEGHDHRVPALKRTTESLLAMFDRFEDRNADSYQPANEAEYPETDLGYRLKHAAQMLKDEPSELNIEAVMVNHEGYDHHAAQVVPGQVTQGNHANLLADLSRGIQALYQDLGPDALDNVVVLVISEFGRTLHQNGSHGTDHGHASVAMVFGGANHGVALNGGADWPGLEGNHLPWRTDYRDIYSEILRGHLNAGDHEIRQAIPNHTPTPLGILG
ncbi:DUF1501 domain-containing protein [Acanthopleuribacter pedis]|uniref:DUF1501 domain-containing protein n=1 Tax=Acanthopleuribacter pedis TaxID=442870 RepID=A0A8J7U2M5_9BACT|nr:DUF1501 domain-containing protein [Acanthopleuribacter pedis]MBO1317413.1 DUF1501 domain-containing protein [Acanthopleuribacter pedis]